jgi:hypothetical protein
VGGDAVDHSTRMLGDHADASDVLRWRMRRIEPLDTCQTLLERQSAIARVLDDLGPSWRDTRAALNELARIVGGG